MPLKRTGKSPNSAFRKLKLPNPKCVFEKLTFSPMKFAIEKSITFSDSKMESIAVKFMRSTFSLGDKLFFSLN